MKCTNCGYANTDGAKFCENCGRPLERHCPNCGNPVSASAKFCGNCGFNLSGTTSPSGVGAASQSTGLDTLRRAIPDDLATKILAERERLDGERKLVTALFTDIVGSTALAETMDPEDWREIVSGAHRRVSEAVYRFEGTIAQLLGDGVLAFFGAPLTHEDDAERAIRAALSIRALAREYAAELRQRQLAPNFMMRIGLNTGMVVVGNIGTDLHMEYLALGDTINLAARMQTTAEPDMILVTENTQRLAANLFEFEDRGKINVKGRVEPVQVYCIVRERTGATRSRGITGLSSPMVGRQREYSSVLQILSELRAGRGSVVTIAGEAGLGKSRLVAEWRKAACLPSLNPVSESPPLRWVEGRCLSYGTSMAYHLATDLLLNLLGVPADASEEETRDALRGSLQSLLGAETEEVYPFLGHLLGIKLEDNLAARVKYLDGPALQAKYASACQAYLRGLARERATILVCEDIHWADPSSVALLAETLSIAAEAPLVFVFVTRPDKDTTGWRLVDEARQVPGAGARELYLTPLTERDSQELVSNLLEVAALPQAVRQLILAKSEGNPFYVEEVIRMLIDRGGIARQDGEWVVTKDLQAIDIPDTLQGVIMSRIDRLPEDAKRTLQIAAVIGRRFQVKVLEMVLEQEGQKLDGR